MAEQSTPEQPKVSAPAEERPQEKRRRLSGAQWIIVIVVVLAAAVGGRMLLAYFASYENTDDAQIDGDIYAVTSRISGAVKAVHVQDNQQVKAGQLLVELDPTDYRLAVDQAQAALHESQAQVAAERPNVPITSTSTETSVLTFASDVAGARAQVAAARAQAAGAQRDHESIVAQIRQAEADQVKTQADLARYRQLLEKDEISRQRFDQADAAAKSMAAMTDSRRASAESAARNVDAAMRNIEAAEAKLKQAETREAEAKQNRPRQIELQTALVNSRQATADRQQTMLNQANVNLSYTNIYSPAEGIVGKKNAEAGQQVSPGQQLMAVVAINNLWVTANFKENQLKKMHPGQRVTLHVDAYDRDYEGTIESIAGASGARFSLLPPENATGNFVKVVQRVPVRIRIKEGQDPDHRLRPGMSVEPQVWIEEK